MGHAGTLAGLMTLRLKTGNRVDIANAAQIAARAAADLCSPAWVEDAVRAAVAEVDRRSTPDTETVRTAVHPQPTATYVRDSTLYLHLDELVVCVSREEIAPIEPFELLDRIYVSASRDLVVKLFRDPSRGAPSPMQGFTLGLTRHGHDASATVISNRTGRVLGFEREERISRLKPGRDFPVQAARSVLAMCRIEPANISGIAIGHNLHWFRDAPSSASPAGAYFGSLGPGFAKADFGLRHDPGYVLARMRQIIPDLDPRRIPIYFVRHHLAHAASCGATESPKDRRALFMVMDGRGEWETVTAWQERNGDLKCVMRTTMPNSLGYVYNMMGRYMGWREFGFEGQIMGLAPYGRARNAGESQIYKQLRDVYDEFVSLDASTSQVRLERSFFTGGYLPDRPDGTDGWLSPFAPSRTMLDRIRALVSPIPSGTTIEPDNPLHRPVCILAFVIQETIERMVTSIATGLLRRHPEAQRLYVSGGVGLNVSANGKIGVEHPSIDVRTTPWAGDDGGSVGAALYVLRYQRGVRRRRRPYDSALLGRSYGADYVESRLRAFGLTPARDYVRFPDHDELCRAVAALLTRGEGVAWFQGREEAGARALGARSLLYATDDRSATLRANRAKRRQPWRPTSISLLERDWSELFDSLSRSPYMTVATQVKRNESSVIAGIHPGDGSSRPQLVRPSEAWHLSRLLDAYGRLNGLGVLINTSLNRSEPLVHWPDDALNDLHYLDGVRYLAISRFLVGPRPLLPSIVAASDEPDLAESLAEFRRGRSAESLASRLREVPQWPHQVRIAVSPADSIPMFREGFDPQTLTVVLAELARNLATIDLRVWPHNSPHHDVVRRLAATGLGVPV